MLLGGCQIPKTAGGVLPNQDYVASQPGMRRAAFEGSPQPLLLRRRFGIECGRGKNNHQRRIVNLNGGNWICCASRRQNRRSEARGSRGVGEWVEAANFGVRLRVRGAIE